MIYAALFVPCQWLTPLFLPRMQETIKFITGKLDEKERSNTSRLMKIKAIRLAQESLREAEFVKHGNP